MTVPKQVTMTEVAGRIVTGYWVRNDRLDFYLHWFVDTTISMPSFLRT
jgi:hypothetical protein